MEYLAQADKLVRRPSKWLVKRIQKLRARREGGGVGFKDEIC